MIKVQSDKIFMTGGDACYALAVEDGALRSLCFGKRGEPEDDFRSLAGVSSEYVSSHVRVRRGDKEFSPKFTVADVRVSEEKRYIPEMPCVRGDKTLTVELVSEKHKLTLEIVYTPLDRGGFAERVTLYNGGAPAEILSVGMGSASIVGNVSPKYFGLNGEAEGEEHRFDAGECGLTQLSSDGATERHGEAFGAFALYGGIYDVCAEARGGKTELSYSFDFSDEPFMLDSEQSFNAPEVVFVYSDCGTGGLTRAVHDIVRERVMPERFGLRRHISLYSDVNISSKAATALCETAAQSGVNTLIVNAEKASDAAVQKYVEACETAGVHAGLHCDFERDDITDGEIAQDIFNKISSLAEAGVKLIKWECVRTKSGAPASYLSERARYSVFSRVTEAYPELVLENGFDGGADFGMLCFAPTAVAAVRESEKDLKEHISAIRLLPPCSLVGYISPSGGSFKTKFDAVSMGVPSYVADGLTQDTVRAMRAQIFCYQDDASVVLGGDCYISSAMLVVSKDKSKAHSTNGRGRVTFEGVDEHNLYLVREMGAVYSGVALSRYGLTVEGGTFHLRQVADYE